MSNALVHGERIAVIAYGDRIIGNRSSSGSGISFTLAVSTDADFIGETLTFTNGTITLTEVVPEYMSVVFIIPEAGTWILTNSLNTDTDTIEITPDYTYELTNTPDGKTVLPTDDIQIWLKCAKITDKAYTTLAEVLNDKDTLVALMASDNAVDYMVRSTSWATQITVPTMTSDTTPSGEVIGTFGATIGSQTYYGWKCFDGDDSTEGVGTSTSNQIIGYMFTEDVCVTKVHLLVDSYRRWSSGAKFQGTEDGSTWEDIYTISNEVSGTVDLIIPNYKSYRGYRFSNINGSQWPSAQTIQFYSASIPTSATAMQAINASDYASDTLLANAIWCEAICNSEYFETVLNAKVPVMTSNTDPSGEASASSVYQTNYAYKAFDGDDSTMWECGFISTDTHPYVQYDFGHTVKICYARALEKGSSRVAYVYGHEIEYSTDNITFSSVASGESSSITSSQSYEVAEIFSLVTGRYFRFRSWRSNQENYSGGDIYTLQFYGRKDV